MPDRPLVYRINQRVQLSLAGCAVVIAALALVADRVLVAALAVAAVAVCACWAAARLASTRRALADVLPLDLAARVVCDAYLSLGELGGAAAASLAIEPRASGYLRCFLRDGTAAECELFATALEDVIASAGFPRYLVSRLVPSEADWPVLLARALTRRAPFERRWVAVPDDFGRSKKRATAFAEAWRRWAGPSELRFTQRTAEGRQTAAIAGAQSSDYQTSSRRIWV